MPKTKNHKARNYLKYPIVWLGIVAAILYSSWPLGYILNPAVAHNAFASQFEAPNQPYNWLFISLDVLSGLALLMVGITQWPKAKKLPIRLSIISYMLFAISVIVAALIPFNCDSVTVSCQDTVHSPFYIIHGVASVVSVAGLLASLFLILNPLLHKKGKQLASLMIGLTLFGWLINGAVAFDDYHKVIENLVQYVFISMCSVSIILAVLVIEYLTPAPDEHRRRIYK